MFSITIRKKAFTLGEVLITIVIISIVVGLAVPQFTKSIESTKAKEAVAALHLIRTGERIYRISEAIYVPAANNAAINNQLNLYLDIRANRNWDYSISADANSFTATARRRSGRNTNETITITHDGTVNKAGWSP